MTKVVRFHTLGDADVLKLKDLPQLFSFLVSGEKEGIRVAEGFWVSPE